MHNMPPRAGSIFTDREAPRKLFWDYYEKVEAQSRAHAAAKSAMPDAQVLHYYGIGGIGKTSLIDRLIKEIGIKNNTRRVRKIRHILIDFQGQNAPRDASGILRAMRTCLVKDHGFAFPLFDLALSRYLLLFAPEETFTEERAKALFEHNFWVRTGINVLSLFKAMSLPVKLFTIVEAAVFQVLATHKKSRLEKTYTAYTNMISSATTLAAYESLLPELFVLDLNLNLDAGHPPPVFFLDTYEAYINEMTGLGMPTAMDQWLRGYDGLIPQLPQVAWVICGRERLKWLDADPLCPIQLTAHLLGELSRADCTSVLRQCGVPVLHDALYDLTQGVPVYLDLCVRIYRECTRRGKPIDIGLFGANQEALILRFTRYMDLQTKLILGVLACLRLWTDEVFRAVVRAADVSVNELTYETVKDLSFISQKDDEYHMHDVIRRVIYQSFAPALRARVDAAVGEHYRRVFETADIQQASTQYALRRYVDYSLKEIETQAQWEQFTARMQPVLDRMEAWHLAQSLRTLYQRMLSLVLKRFPQSIYQAQISLLYAKALLQTGDAHMAIDISQVACDLFRSVQGAYHSDTIAALLEHAHMLCENGRADQAVALLGGIDMGKALEAGASETELRGAIASAHAYADQWELAVQEARTLYAHIQPDLDEASDAHLAQFVSAAELLTRMLSNTGAFAEAIEVGKDAVSRADARACPGSERMLRLYQRMARCYADLEEIENAEAFLRREIEETVRLYGEDHPDVLLNKLSALQSGIVMEGTGKDSGSRPVSDPRLVQDAEQIYETLKAMLGTEHPLSLSALSRLSSIYILVGDGQTAIDLLKPYLDGIEDRLAQIGRQSLRYLRLADLFSICAFACNKVGEDEQAVNAMQTSYDMECAYWGDSPLNTARSALLLTGFLRKTGRYEEAAALLAPLYRQLKAELGAAVPIVSEARDALISAYVRTQDIDALLALSQNEDGGDEFDAVDVVIKEIIGQNAEPEYYGYAAFAADTLCKLTRRLHPDSHPKVLVNLVSWLTMLHLWDDMAAAMDEAKEGTEQLAQIVRAHWPQGHIYHTCALINLAVYYRVQGNSHRAVEILREVYPLCAAVYGTEHPRCAKLNQFVKEEYETIGEPLPAYFTEAGPSLAPPAALETPGESVTIHIAEGYGIESRADGSEIALEHAPDAGPDDPVLYWNGQLAHILLRRTRNEYILVDHMHPDVQPHLVTKSTVRITEVDSNQEPLRTYDCPLEMTLHAEKELRAAIAYCQEHLDFVDYGAEPLYMFRFLL